MSDLREMTPSDTTRTPLVSVVTPFHNTAAYLAECIESVLAQSYRDFEYLLVDNGSSDGSTEIAERYARLDPRIRHIRHDDILPQVANYNRALAQISPQSTFCKVVQADDWIFPECLERMVAVFGQSHVIGLVGSYHLKGTSVRPSGFPLASSAMDGRAMGRLYLRGDVWAFGSPTSVMYRSAIIRERAAFFDESVPNEDTERCMQILERWDFGFAYQVLSFLRVGNESITMATRGYRPGALDYYIVARRYGPRFLDADAAAGLARRARRQYYRALASRVLRNPSRGLFRYHAAGLRTLDESFDWARLAVAVIAELGWMLVNPGDTLAGLAGRLRRGARTAPAHAGHSG